MKDLQDNEILEGDRIAYAVREGDHAALRVGTVLRFTGSGRVRVMPDGKREWSDKPMKATSIMGGRRALVLARKEST